VTYSPNIDIAARVYNHSWKIDPVVRSLIDTDFYKLLMCQFILLKHPKTEVKFKLINRSYQVPLAQLIDRKELEDQLDHIRTLRLSKGESTWLRGNMFYGTRSMFSPDFIDWFENLRLPPYQLEVKGDQFELSFVGYWPEVMLWEIPALAVLTELRSRAVLRQLGRFDLQVLYARGMTRIWEKISQLNQLEAINIADFGTRRRHSYLWQEWCVQALLAGLGNKFLGTSNCLIAKRLEVEAIGTNAHELPMVYCALAENNDTLAQAPYKVLEDWQQVYGGNLKVILADTYGTQQLLSNAPSWLHDWKGIRIDSGVPEEMGEIAIQWWKQNNQNLEDKLLIFSDGLDVDKIILLYNQFSKRVKVSFGWGTLLTNDFRGFLDDDELAPISLVCKAISAEGKPTVKISDNPLKASGPPELIDHYKSIFGVKNQKVQEVIV